MPPRYAYWTILVDEQPTAFRAGDRDELLPTFKRLQQKHSSARMVWFQNGKVWNSRLEAQEAMHLRGERGRQGDFRQRQRDRREGKLEWQPKPERREGRLEWKPKGSPADRSRLEWKPKGSSADSAARGGGPRRSAKREGGPSRDRNWRPGGEHRDPRQKYKDAKKAKWTRFKKQIRTRWDAKQTRKKKDDE